MQATIPDNRLSDPAAIKRRIKALGMMLGAVDPGPERRIKARLEYLGMTLHRLMRPTVALDTRDSRS